MNDKLGRRWMQTRGSFKGGLLWVWPATLWALKCHIDAFYIAFGVTSNSLNFPRTIRMPFSFSLQYHASFRVKPKINLWIFFVVKRNGNFVLISQSKVRCNNLMIERNLAFLIKDSILYYLKKRATSSTFSQQIINNK